MSSEFEQKLEKLVEQAPENRHSYFQLKYFVVGKEPTLQAQMWQCLRELQARKETLDSIVLEIDDTKDQLELLEIEQKKEHVFMRESGYGEEKHALKQKEMDIKLRRLDRQKTSLRKTLKQLESKHKFTLQEARFFVQAFESLEKVEPLKDYDDLDAQQEYWNEIVGQKINLKMLLQQPLDTELVQTALALHDNAPVKIQIVQMLDKINYQLAQLKEKHKLKTKEDNAKIIESRQEI